MAINKDFVVKNGLVLNGSVTANNSTGTSGQVLVSSGTGVYWGSVSSGGGTGATNLTSSANSSTVTIFSDTGTDAVISGANQTTAGLITSDSQIFAGQKTFANTSIFNDSISVGVNTASGYAANIYSGNRDAVKIKSDTGISLGLFGRTGDNSAQIRFYNNSNTLSAIFGLVGTDLRFYTNGSTEQMRIANTGNIGIGTTAPTTKLEVAGDIKINSNFVLNSEATTLATVTKTQVASFPSASFRSAKLLAQAFDANTGEVQISELLVAHNGTTASATEYGVVFTGTLPIVSYDVDILSGNVRLLATRTTTNSTQYKVSETLMVS